MCDYVNIEKTLTPPEEFDFPFPPYSIQHDFMYNLYSVIENKKLGIFESPTGTGKSLSIICGALKWLKDHNDLVHSNLEEKISELQLDKEKLQSSSNDWLSTQAKEIELNRKLQEIKVKLARINEYDEKIEQLQNKVKTSKKKVWEASKKAVEVNDANVEENEDDLVLEDVIPGAEEESDDESETEDAYVPVKIYICSRTHSQLSQFVGEIIKSPYGATTRTISLASRQNYCINPNVSRLKNMSLINEKCLEMQKNKSASCKTDTDGKVVKRKKGTSGSCPFYKQQNIESLRDLALTEIQDVEDIIKNGKALIACPYYASRKAAEDAQIVLVPYNTLLHKATREANGIKLKNNVVIIDEAHNLLEALAQMHSCSVTHDQLHYALLQLKNYKQKYNTRFSSTNLLCINQMIFVVKKIFEAFDRRLKIMEGETEIYTITNFISNAEIDNFNMFKLLRFCKDSRIAQKLHGFALKYPDMEEPKKAAPLKGLKDFLQSIENKPKNQQSQPAGNEEKASVSVPSNPLLAVIGFLESLTYSYDDGRIFIQKNEEVKCSRLQFLLLNPAAHFQEVVKEARAVIVAGGTMKPNSEFRERLFIAAGGNSDRIQEFSCDHIIPAENILPIILTEGPKNNQLSFNYENRLSMGDSLKNILLEVCKRVKGGIVVFFPSYKYEAWFWQQSQGLNFNRKVFREPKDSGSVDDVLNSYADTIRKNKTGALLFSVVGGKLSEGLNFSDDLGRCVIVVGMPYANVKAADLKEKMTYLNKTEGVGTGQKFYENLCMKAVNQCIGRAVRHRNDFASVLLLDERYNRTATKNALPGWIKRSLQVCKFNECLGLLDEFFKKKSGT